SAFGGVPGRYDLVLNTSSLNGSAGLHPGTFLINITYKKINHELSFITINLTIKTWQAFIYVENDPYSSYTQWKHLGIQPVINCSVWLYDPGHDTEGINQTVDLSFGATVSVKITDLNNITLKSDIIMNFSGGFWRTSEKLNLSDDSFQYLPPGDYYVWFTITHPFFQKTNLSYELKILERANATFENLQIPRSLYSFDTLKVTGTFLIDFGNGFVAPSPWIDWRQVRVQYSITYHYAGGRTYVESGETEIKSTGDFIITSKTTIGMDVQSITVECWIDEQNSDWPALSVNAHSSGEVSISVTLSPLMFMMMMLAGVGTVGIAGTMIIVVVKRARSKKIAALELKTKKKFDYFSDLISIRKIYLVQRNKNKIMFENHYNREDFSPEENQSIEQLVNSYGKDIQNYRASLDLTFYDGYKLIIDDGMITRLALVTNKIPSERFLRGLTRFLQYFEVNALQEIQKTGEIKDKAEVLKLLDSIFDISVILPYRISYKAMKKSLNHFQNQLLMDARDMSTDGYFFISNLFEKITRESLMPQEYIFQEISALIANGVFVPFTFEEILEKGKEIKYYSFFDEIAEKQKEEVTVETVQKKAEQLVQDEAGYLTPASEMEEMEEEVEHIEDEYAEDEYTEDYGLIEEEEIIEEVSDEELTPFEKIIEEEGIVTSKIAPSEPEIKEKETPTIEEIEEPQITPEDIQKIFESVTAAEEEIIEPPKKSEIAPVVEESLEEIVEEEIIEEPKPPETIPEPVIPKIENLSQITQEILQNLPDETATAVETTLRLKARVQDLDKFIEESVNLFDESKPEIEQVINKINSRVQKISELQDDDFQDMEYDISLASETVASAFENLVRMEKRFDDIRDIMKKHAKSLQKIDKQMKKSDVQNEQFEDILSLIKEEKKLMEAKIKEFELR
ncbi:MAG: coiled-coil domain-containing protein, partial [Candidatus Helarchaeales archaeon]